MATQKFIGLLGVALLALIGFLGMVFSMVRLAEPHEFAAYCGLFFGTGSWVVNENREIQRAARRAQKGEG